MRLYIVPALLAAATVVSAQEPVVLQGRLLNSLTAAPVGAATVVLEEQRRETTSDADGMFRFENLTPGTYHVSVRTTGYSSRRTEVVVPGPAGVPIDVFVDPDLHFQEVASVTAEARSQFDVFQPTTVLAGQDLTKQLESSLGATLDNSPGVASRSFGPAPSRPVIRGLDGDRVQILQDGQRPGDLSSQSGDHGVSVNPSAAESIEVVRGPATLLYGANAIGGLVNVLTNEIPTRPLKGLTGTIGGDLATNAIDAGTNANIQFGNGRYAMSMGGGARHADDFDTPLGEVDNSQSRSAFGSMGGAWTGERVHVGASYNYDESKYGIPVLEGGTLQLTPKRHAVTARVGAERLQGLFDGFRTTLAYRAYEHQELEGSEVGTVFTNDTTEFQVLGSHRSVQRLKGSIGGSLLGRAFDAVGPEALSPAVDQNGAAVFLYEELSWPHVTVQFGARGDHTRYEPLGEAARDFTNGSLSAGILLRPAAAQDRLTFAASVAHAARPPALEELFFFGLHSGNFAVEVGNPDLESERAFGLDLSLRWRTPRASGEITYFRNDIKDFIYRREMSPEEFEAREQEFIDRFGGRQPAGHEHEGEEGAGEEIAYVEYVGADALLQGVEAHSDFQITARWSAELGLDYVRGSLKDEDVWLPRIPPLKGRGGLRYQRNALQVGGQVIVAASQNNVSGLESPTDGYTLLRLYSSYSFPTGGAASTITVRLDNATNELYRNHLSLIKDEVPEMGRNLKVVYALRF